MIDNSRFPLPCVVGVTWPERMRAQRLIDALRPYEDLPADCFAGQTTVAEEIKDLIPVAEDERKLKP